MLLPFLHCQTLACPCIFSCISRQLAQSRVIQMFASGGANGLRQAHHLQSSCCLRNNVGLGELKWLYLLR